MAKTKKKSDRELERRREIKKLSMRRARERLKNDPIKYAEEKRKDRERKKRSRRPVQDLNEREQRKIRKNWREHSKRYRNKKRDALRMVEYEDNFLESRTPPESPQMMLQLPEKQSGSRNSTPRERGKKLARKNRDKLKNRINDLENLVYSLKKAVNKYKKRASRANKIKSHSVLSPRSKVNQLQKQTVSSEVRKKLLFAEVIGEQVRRNFSREKIIKKQKIFLVCP